MENRRTRGKRLPNGMTLRQQEALNHIIISLESRGYPPTVRELGRALDINSLRGVTVHLDALAKKGFIRRDKSKPRAITLTEKARHEMGMNPVWKPSEQLTNFVSKLTPHYHGILVEVAREVNG